MSNAMQTLQAKLAVARARESVAILTTEEAGMLARVGLEEDQQACHFTYGFINRAPVSVDEYLHIQGEIDHAVRLRAKGTDLLALYQARDALPQEIVWEDGFRNTVVTVGKNDLLDKYFAGSTYTAAFFVGLISSTSYSAIAAGDTMSSHAGWLEAGVANTPTYSQSTRPAPTFSAASAGSKATSSAMTFSITGTGTVKGGFVTTVSTKDGTTGILYSAGLFTGGDQPVVNANTLSVSLTVSA